MRPARIQPAVRSAFLLAASLALPGASGCRFWVIPQVAPDAALARDVGAPPDAPDAVTSDVSAPDVEPVDLPAPDASDAPTDARCDSAACVPIQCAAERAAIVGDAGRFDVRNYLFSPVAVHGPNACPLLVSADARPFAGIASVGRGRVVVFGHDVALWALLTDPNVSSVVLGAVSWLGRSAAPRVGIDRATAAPAFTDLLVRQGWAVRVLDASALRPGEIDVWVSFATTAPAAPRDVETVRAFVDQGGGVLLAGQAWNWARSNPGPVAGYPGNALLPAAGLMIISAQMGTEETSVGASVSPPPHAHALVALDRVEPHLRGVLPLGAAEQRSVARVLSDAVDHVPFDGDLFQRTLRLAEVLPPATPTVGAPLVVANAPFDALRHRALGRALREGPASRLRAASSAAEFPGDVTGTPTRRTVTLDARAMAQDAANLYSNPTASQWRSTGLYALPGVPITVTVPREAATVGLVLQIGHHDRTLWNETSWSRVPELLRRDPIDRTTVTSTNPYGGWVWVLVPVGASIGEIEVTIDGAAAAPVFLRGATDAAAWREEVLRAGVPWAELRGRALTLLIPVAQARGVTDPEGLVAHWDTVMDSMADLSGIPRSRSRPEMVVFDRQFPGGGTADAGYPVTRSVSAAGQATDLAALRSSGDWGTYYTLGRLHVSRDWLLPGSDDATASIFSLHAFERVLSIGVEHSPPPHGSLTPGDRAFRRRRYLEAGRNFTRDWNSFTALETYLQLQTEFGWGMFTRAFVAYRSLAAPDRPRDDAERVQQWVRRTSVSARIDLSPFYDAWALPLTSDTRSATSALPVWSRPPPLP